VDFTAVIQEDIQKFNKFQLGHNQKKPFERWTLSGTFVPIKEAPNSFVYRHSRYAIFSSIQSIQFFHMWDILPDNVVTHDRGSCVRSHCHDTLEPYFSDKEFFFSYLRNRISNDASAAELLQSFIDEYENKWFEPKGICLSMVYMQDLQAYKALNLRISEMDYVRAWCQMFLCSMEHQIF